MSFRQNTRAEGGPQPGGPLSTRQKDFIKLLFSVILLGVFSIRVGSLLDITWESNGFARTLIYQLTSGFNIDFIILLPFGITVAWIFLFTIDKTKKLQRWLLLIAFGSVVGWITVIEGRWGTEMVAWLRFWYILVIGLIIGLISGSLSQLLGVGRRREFPPAAVGLFLLVFVLCTTAFVDTHLISPVVADDGGVFPSSNSMLGTFIDVLTTGGFISLFGWFIFYSEFQSVTILSSEPSLSVAILSGLLYHTQDEYSGKADIGGVSLSNYYHTLQNGTQPNILDSNQGSDNYFEITYLSPSKPSIWVRIGTHALDIRTLTQSGLDQIQEQLTKSNIIVRIRDFITNEIFPGKLKKAIKSQTGLLVSNIDQADMLIYVMSADELSNNGSLGDLRISDISPPSELEIFTQLAENENGKKSKIIVVTDAEQGLHLSQADSIYERSYSRFIRGQLLDLSSDYSVIPVSWATEVEKNGEIIGGIEKLRQKLDK